MPRNTHPAEQWSVEEKLTTVSETAFLSEAELNEYCREKGLTPDQIQRWEARFLQVLQDTESQEKNLRQQTRKNKQTIKELQRELRKKEKALAEATALLTLREKLDALWDKGNEDR